MISAQRGSNLKYCFAKNIVTCLGVPSQEFDEKKLTTYLATEMSMVFDLR